MKRYRDCNGRFTAPIEMIAKETAMEAAKYYTIGDAYIYAEDSETYVYIENDGVLAHFYAGCYKNLFIPVYMLGTFLPGVASDDLKLVKLEG